jgi:hypothetical protein
VTDPADLLAEAPVRAAVTALADRNERHFAEMSPDEQADALEHWRELAVIVLSAAGAALGADAEDEAEGRGRAVIVLEDAGPDEVAVHATFHPQLEETAGEVLVTPAQAAALELLESITGEEP